MVTVPLIPATEGEQLLSMFWPVVTVQTSLPVRSVACSKPFQSPQYTKLLATIGCA